jgi:hypothetical protein
MKVSNEHRLASEVYLHIEYNVTANLLESDHSCFLKEAQKHLQQEAGIGEPLLEFPDIYIPYLTPTWLTSIRQYMSNHNLTVSITDVLTLCVRRPGDSFIMVASHLSRYSALQQKDLNLVRLHLQVTYLSDMANPDDKTLITSSLNGERSTSFQSTSLWQRQETPTKA